jgi:trehalose-6-phosphatase
MLISVDFDGTIVEHKFPEIGEPLPGAAETLKDLTAAGHILILNTCREDEKRRAYLTEAVNFMKKHGVEFASVNENRMEDEFRDKPGRKVYANVYIDDRNLGGFPGWATVREAFGLTPLTSSA